MQLNSCVNLNTLLSWAIIIIILSSFVVLSIFYQLKQMCHCLALNMLTYNVISWVNFYSKSCSNSIPRQECRVCHTQASRWLVHSVLWWNKRALAGEDQTRRPTKLNILSIGIWLFIYAFCRPMRGVGAVVAGAGPAHAFYFATYEYTKEVLSKQYPHQNQLNYGKYCYSSIPCFDLDFHMYVYINVCSDGGGIGHPNPRCHFKSGRSD